MTFRLRLAIWSARLFAKPVLARASDPRRNDQLLEAGARHVFRAPPYTLYRRARIVENLNGVWVSTRPGSRPVPTDKVILYIHGGGFIAGSSRTHGALAARLSWISGIEVLLPDYRLAPEHPFPAAFDDVRATWDALIERGYRPENIAIAGDSAGGNLALALLSDLCAEGTPPAGVACLSPLTDFTFESPSFFENAAQDAMLPASRAGDVARWYLAGHDPNDPRLSPVRATFTSPPPVLLHYAEDEILRDDSARMAEVLRAAGGQVELKSWPSAPHVFQVFDGYVPEARESLRDVALFLKRVLSRPK